ncbi:MAG: PSD1 domain-containing protein [Verrucomicrobiales bacterium]|nr:PSD1 domain-containing protein [Verrucomicrobiales bacterium]
MTKSPAACLPSVAIASIWAVACLGVSAEIDFEREIRPILAEKCLLCHGPDDSKGGLRLTGLDFATRELESGHRGIVPGRPELSAVMGRVQATDPDEVMPPPDKGEPLTDAEKAKLRQWIAEGARWPKHWAYTPLSQPEPPAVASAAWVKSPIDAFVLAGLEARKIAPSPEADEVALIRRLYYDLIGLPPTPAEVDRYRGLLAADREAGLSKLADDLLASVHFGERWGRHWLDKARYADSDGYEKDNNRPDAWRYRDWVIDAINRDLPFDQFTIEQFAGDLLEKATPEQRLATAFNRQTLTNTEGGTDKEQWRVAAVMDRVETMGAVWMGLTLGCARCHTHKYDEVTHAEYYQLFAYFNNGDEVNSKVPVSETAWKKWEADMEIHRGKLAALRGKSDAARRELADRLLEWEARASGWIAAGEAVQTPTYAPIAVEGFAASVKGVAFAREKDGSIVVGGQNPAEATYTVTGKLPAGTLHGLRVEVLPDDSLGGKGPGRTAHGNFVLSEVEIHIAGYPRNPIILAGARADYSQPEWDVAGAIDGNAKAKKDGGTGWAVGGKTGQSHEAVFAFAEPVVVEQAAAYTVKLVQNHGEQHTIGRFRLSGLTSPTPLTVPAPVRFALKKPADQRSAEEQATLLSHFERLDARTWPLLAELNALEAALPARPEMDVRVIGERSGDWRQTHVLRRGEFKQPTDAVQAGTLAVLPPVKHRGERGDRLDLARWLVGGENPLTPRVVANEIWANLFGEGIVTTLNDFGVRGERPTHPALLDWIAAEFVANGWSRKRLIKTIVMSNTYRQSSAHRSELVDIDPKNHLLARQNRFRVEGEIVRDISLAASGLLSAKVGGPSVFPPIPPGVADVNYNSAFKWTVSPGEDRYRRGMYTFFKRTAPHPNLMTFDCPDSNVTTVQRSRSNTPLAALVTLNNESFTEAAQALTNRVWSEIQQGSIENDTARLALAFRLCVSREPRPVELDRLTSLLETSRAYYRKDTAAAERFAGVRLPAGLSAGEAAAWTATVRVLLNLDEFLTRS